MYLWEQILCYLLPMREAIVWWKWSASTKSKHSIIQSYVLSSGGLWLTVTKENEKLLLFLIFRNAFQLIAQCIFMTLSFLNVNWGILGVVIHWCSPPSKQHLWHHRTINESDHSSFLYLLLVICPYLKTKAQYEYIHESTGLFSLH